MDSTIAQRNTIQFEVSSLAQRSSTHLRRATRSTEGIARYARQDPTHSPCRSSLFSPGSLTYLRAHTMLRSSFASLWQEFQPLPDVPTLSRPSALDCSSTLFAYEQPFRRPRFESASISLGSEHVSSAETLFPTSLFPCKRHASRAGCAQKYSRMIDWLIAY